MNNLGNSNESKGSSVESLVRLLVTTTYSRINLHSSRIANEPMELGKFTNLREKFKEMLYMEERKYPEEKQKYESLRNIVDKFFSYITNKKVVDGIQNGKISKKDLENNFLSEITYKAKRKYNMQDLYRTDLIASIYRNGSEKNVIMSFKDNGQEHVYKDNYGTSYRLTDIGSIAYEEWSGIKSDLSIYQLIKENTNGTTSKDLICTKVNIPEMDNPNYKKAVLEELFSHENIHKSNVGIYIGQIVKRKPTDNNDLVNTEKQTTNEYTYRVSSEYVLEYDSTELSAVIEAIKKFINHDKMNQPESRPHNRNNEQNSR